MLKIAFQYRHELNNMFIDTMYKEKYKYYFTNSYYDYNTNISEDSWTQMDFVSVNRNNEIVGFLSASIDRNANHISNIRAVNFYKPNITFAKDLFQFLHDLLFKFNFNKLCFSVVVGNPAEQMYDRYIKKYNGRVVGVFEDEVVLYDGKHYDVKYYEVHKKNIKLK